MRANATYFSNSYLDTRPPPLPKSCILPWIGFVCQTYLNVVVHGQIAHGLGVFVPGGGELWNHLGCSRKIQKM